MNNFLNIKIYPNNSLSQKGFYILMIFITLPSLFIGGMFFFMGAWPVLGFMGLELILIYIFFKILFYKNNFYEHITLDKRKFNIHYSNKNKIFNTIALEPTWLKVNIENKNKTLVITTHGKTIELGKCLALKEKTNLAETIKSALITWRENSQSTNSALKH